MTTYLDATIREVMDRFPEVGTILDAYGVGCITCAVGTCPVKDIISIHNLSPEDERVVMSRIAAAVGEAGECPSAAPELADGNTQSTRGRAGSAVQRYSPPLKQLVEEHLLIKRWLALIPAVVEGLDLESPEDRQRVLDGVDFIRSYADRLHHAKEEDILFGYFDESRPIVQAMLTDHREARAHAGAIEAAVRAGDRDKVAHHLYAYRDLLDEHIKKEDEILYPWMDRDLTTSQVGELFARFAEVDRQIGAAVSARNTRFVERAERSVAKKKEEAR